MSSETLIKPDGLLNSSIGFYVWPIRASAEIIPGLASENFASIVSWCPGAKIRQSCLAV